MWLISHSKGSLWRKSTEVLSKLVGKLLKLTKVHTNNEESKSSDIFRAIMAGLASRIARLQLSKGVSSGLPGVVSPVFRVQALRGYRRTLEMDDADLEGGADSSSGSGTRNRRRRLDLDDSQLGGTESLSEWGKGQDREQPAHTPREKCLNQVTLLGRIGQDPQIRGSQAKPVTTFSLATNSSWKTDDYSEWQTRTEWHRITVFKPSLQDAVYNFLTKV